MNGEIPTENPRFTLGEEAWMEGPAEDFLWVTPAADFDAWELHEWQELFPDIMCLGDERRGPWPDPGPEYQ